MPQRIRILNPVPTGAAYCGPERAAHYVKTGRAEWLTPGRMIRFNEQDSRYQAVMRQSMETRAGYDGRGGLTLNEIRNIPVLNPQKMRR